MAEPRTSPEQRAALRRLHEGATPEPWGWNSYSGIAAPVPEGHPLEDYEESDPGDRGLAWICWIDGGPRQKGHGDELVIDEARNNAALIEALRNAAPALLDDADALAGALAVVAELRARIRAAMALAEDEHTAYLVGWRKIAERMAAALAGPAPESAQNDARMPHSAPEDATDEEVPAPTENGTQKGGIGR